MTDFKLGDRVRVITDLECDGEYVGRVGVVQEEPKFFKGAEGVARLSVGFGVKLDGEQGVLEFMPDELARVDQAREEFITSLRQLADFLTVNPDVPTPDHMKVQMDAPYGASDDEQRAWVDRAALAMGVEAGDPYGKGAHWKALLRFGPIEYFALAIDEQHMADYEERDRLGREAFEARLKVEAEAQAAEEFEPAPFVKATPAEAAEAYESSAQLLTAGGAQ